MGIASQHGRRFLSSERHEGSIIHALHRQADFREIEPRHATQRKPQGGALRNDGIMALNSHLLLLNPHASSASSAPGMMIFPVPSL